MGFYHPPSSCSTNAKVLVTGSMRGLRLRSRHLVPGTPPDGAFRVAPASRIVTLFIWIVFSSSFLLTTGRRWRSVLDSSTGSEMNLSQLEHSIAVVEATWDLCDTGISLFCSNTRIAFRSRPFRTFATLSPCTYS